MFSVHPRFDFRDRLRLSSEVLNLRSGTLDLSWVQLVEGIKKTAKVVLQQGHPPLKKGRVI
jgi:hypothetical protein